MSEYANAEKSMSMKSTILGMVDVSKLALGRIREETLEGWKPLNKESLKTLVKEVPNLPDEAFFLAGDGRKVVGMNSNAVYKVGYGDVLKTHLMLLGKIGEFYNSMNIPLPEIRGWKNIMFFMATQSGKHLWIMPAALIEYMQEVEYGREREKGRA